MTPYILAVLALYFVQTFAPSLTRSAAAGESMLKVGIGPRDDLPEAGLRVRRFMRATENMKEALFLFLPIALLCEMKGLGDSMATTGALIFLIARVIYIPCYVFHPPLMRPLVWLTSLSGIALMITALLQSG
ncbi:MAG: MAPEG family protein [Alphaproteobacteria bacterium]